jgi:hypothetical protein
LPFVYLASVARRNDLQIPNYKRKGFTMLSNILNKTRKPSDPDKPEWIGLKLAKEDANELRALLGTKAEGADLMRVCLAYIVEHKA